MSGKLTKGKYTLEHNRYIDDFGFEKDSFDLFDTEKRVHFPFHGFPKVSNMDKDFPINRIPYDYTKEDYEEMLNAQITKYETNKI